MSKSQRKPPILILNGKKQRPRNFRNFEVFVLFFALNSQIIAILAVIFMIPYEYSPNLKNGYTAL